MNAPLQQLAKRIEEVRKASRLPHYLQAELTEIRVALQGIAEDEQQFVMLVYQAGIANVFLVECLNVADFGRNAKLLYQGDFYGAVQFAQGMGAAGACVRTVHCNMAGDITHQHWTEDLETAPFSNSRHFVNLKIN